MGVDKSDIQFCNLNEETYTYGSNTTPMDTNITNNTFIHETIAKTIDYEVNVNPKQNDQVKMYITLITKKRPLNFN